MNDVVGHSRVVTALNSGKHKNILLVGPFSVGKRTMLQTLLKPKEFQVFSHTVDASILETVREMSHRKNTNIFLRLDSVNRSETEKLLKIIEDSDESVRFYCTSVKEIDQALRNRFSTFYLSYLSDTEVRSVLEKNGLSPAKAEELASKMYGQIIPTMQSDGVVLKTNVMLALKHIIGHDPDNLDKMHSKWSSSDTDLLLIYAKEVITGRPRVFNSEEIGVVEKRLALKILKHSDRNTTPRFFVRSILASIEKEMSE